MWPNNTLTHIVNILLSNRRFNIKAKKKLLMQSGDTHSVAVGNNQEIIVENNQLLMSRNKDIQLEAATDIKFVAKQSVQVEAQAQDIKIDAEKDFVMRAGL